jgi:hypothetical protein
MELTHALNAIDNTLLLTKQFILKSLGKSALEKFVELFFLMFYFSQLNCFTFSKE